MKILLAAAVVAFVAGPAFAQTQKPVPRYGEDSDKSESEIRAEKEADKAYQKSLGNIPAQKSADPWGTVRSEPTPKAAPKDPPAKRAKAGATTN